jgi:hypothetical protein
MDEKEFAYGAGKIVASRGEANADDSKLFFGEIPPFPSRPLRK